MPRAGVLSTHTLPTGSDALILAHLATGAQVSRLHRETLHCTSLSSQPPVFIILSFPQQHAADPYDLSNDEDDHAGKDGNKSYR